MNKRLVAVLVFALALSGAAGLPVHMLVAHPVSGGCRPPGVQVVVDGTLRDAAGDRTAAGSPARCGHGTARRRARRDQVELRGGWQAMRDDIAGARVLALQAGSGRWECVP